MGNLTFIIDGQKADISENVDFNRIYRGLETTDAKKNNYSLTVKFPFTYANELLFKRTNSLSYKSDFPYQTHECSVSSNGITIINKAKLVLLSTTDSFECSLTWDNFDFVGTILNNQTKLGILLKDFPSLDWNYKDSATYGDDHYTTIKANTYGYCRYVNYVLPGTATPHFTTYPHPLINFNYLLDLIFTELGIIVTIPTLKNDFLQKLIIRPHKEIDIYTNNIFESNVLYLNSYIPPATENIYALQFDYIREGVPTPLTQTFGNNSYYFKSWVDNATFDDGLALNNGYGNIPQTKRIRSFANTLNNEITISNFILTIGAYPVFVKYDVSDGLFYDLFTVYGNGTHYFNANEGDWFYFRASVSGDNVFKFKIETPIDETLTNPNQLFFPSKYHIPTCIDMTVGEYVNQALQLTGSELTYDVNTDTYLFVEKTQENSTAYDITENILSVKEITYDTKYLYSKLGQSNVFRYFLDTPINANYIITVANTKLVLERTFINLLFSPSLTEAGGYYDGFCIAREHEYFSRYVKFQEQPLHLLWNDSAVSKIRFTNDLLMSNIFTLFYTGYWADLEALVLAGTVRLIKLDTSITDVEFKRINTKGLVYVKTFGKYYGIIEIIKNGDDAEFFLLELY